LNANARRSQSQIRHEDATCKEGISTEVQRIRRIKYDSVDDKSVNKIVSKRSPKSINPNNKHNSNISQFFQTESQCLLIKIISSKSPTRRL